jgi:ribosomal protein S12 methylthiotransferase accessory factor
VLEATLAEWPLDEPALAPGQCTLFHPEQYALPDFPYVPFTPSTPIRWVCGRELASGDPLWMPAELLFLGGSGAALAPVSPSISTGLACGRVGDPVALRGLQEVIERDAIVGAWWRRYALDEHDASEVFALLPADVRARVERPNVEYRFYRIDTPFSAHVTLTASRGEERRGFCFSAGAACRETRGASWSKSLLEAVQGRSYARHLRDTLGAVDDAPSSFAEHALYYSLHPEQLADTALADARRAPRDAQRDAVERLDTLRERLGARPIVVRHMTPIGIAAANLDWCVLRICVPSLQALHGDHRFPLLGGPLWAPRDWRDWVAMPPHPFA